MKTRVIELEDGKTVTEIDVQFMELSEIQELIDTLQSEIFKLAKEKKQISTLPKCQKTQKTLKRLTKVSTRLMELQEAQCWIGRIKKVKRDNQSKERNWYKTFYTLIQDTIRKKDFDKVVEQTNIKMQYSI